MADREITQPDEAPGLRPGGGTQLHTWGPNESCPYLPPNINEVERLEKMLRELEEREQRDQEEGQ